MATLKKEDSQLADANDKPLIGPRQSAITAPTGGMTTDAEARTAINAIITALEAHGLVESNDA